MERIAFAVLLATSASRGLCSETRSSREGEGGEAFSVLERVNGLYPCLTEFGEIEYLLLCH